MAFTVGMKVERFCGSETNARNYGAPFPRLHVPCTVSNVYMDADSDLHIELIEYPSPARAHSGGYYTAGFLAEFFRPLISCKTDISFTTGADPESEKWDNRKPLPVYTFDTTEHESIMQYLRGFY